MASSTVAVVSDPPPPPPPTSDALEVFNPSSKSPNTLKRALDSSKKCLLPFIDPSVSGGSVTFMKSEAHPSNTGNDFLPTDLLHTLKRQDNANIRSTPRQKGGSKLPLNLNTSTPRETVGGGFKSVGPPAPVWNHPSRRDRLKHLTEAPPCVCGAGRDISFLYDSPPKEKEEKTKKFVPSDTIIPAEYHIVKHPGVLGLEFHDESYTTLSDNHDYHMTVFPSTKPSGRHEALALMHTFDSMLQRAGVPTVVKDTDLQGPTEMHKLLDLVQKEQTIYNVVFHEVIRQVSMHCVERGEILADLRRRYANLLDRIPRQVKSLHDEVLAQRVLDRKLTAELNKFQNKISSLTEELSIVKEHDLHVTEQSKFSEDTLSAAIATSRKSADILNEYHELYELQRRRLEEVVAQLTRDQELWQQASYDLSVRVAEQYDVQTLQRLQLNEKSWSKLAGHFAILLSSRDSQQLSEIQDCIQIWKGKLKSFLTSLIEMETSMRERLLRVRDGFVKWIEVYKKTVNPADGTVTVPSHKYLGHLWAEMKVWLGVINKEAENFTGDQLVNNQDSIKGLSELVEKWTSIAMVIFGRHQQEVGGAASGRVGESVDMTEGRQSVLDSRGEGEGDESKMTQQFKNMVELKRAIETKLTMYESRSSGENGVATGFVHLTTPLEAWDTKLSLIMTGTEKKVFLPASDWNKLGKLMEDWKERIEDIIGWVGTVPPPPAIVVEEVPVEGSEEGEKEKTKEGVKEGKGKEEEEEEGKGEGEEGEKEEGTEGEEEGELKARRVSERTDADVTVEELCSDVERWSVDLSYAIDTQDSKRAEQVSRLHSDLVKWIVRLLLSITDGAGEGGEGEEDEERHLRHIQSTANLKSDCMVLVQALNDFTKRLQASCTEVVREIVQDRIKQGYPNPEEEKLDLQRMEQEAEELTMLAETLVKKVRSGYRARRSTQVRRVVSRASELGAVSSDVVIKVEDTEQVPPNTAERTESAASLREWEVEEERQAPSASPDEMHVMGEDKNIHQKPIKQVIEESEAPTIATSADLGLATEEDVPNGRGSTPDNAERLIIMLDEAKESLKVEQEAKQQLEEKVSARERELSEMKAKMAELEEELKAAKTTALHQTKSSHSSKSGKSGRRSVVSRGGSKHGAKS